MLFSHQSHMMSSTKPEVHKMLHCRQRRTEPRTQVTCTENFVKFDMPFLVNVNSRSLYAIARSSVCRLSVICRL